MYADQPEPDQLVTIQLEDGSTILGHIDPNTGGWDGKALNGRAVD